VFYWWLQVATEVRTNKEFLIKVHIQIRIHRFHLTSIFFKCFSNKWRENRELARSKYRTNQLCGVRDNKKNSFSFVFEVSISHQKQMPKEPRKAWSLFWHRNMNNYFCSSCVHYLVTQLNRYLNNKTIRSITVFLHLNDNTIGSKSCYMSGFRAIMDNN